MSSASSSTAQHRTLLRQVADDDNAGIIDTATAILRPSTASVPSTSPVDAEVLSSLVVALLHQQRPEEVDRLAALERYVSAFASSPSLSFYHAYALYKMKRIERCLALLRSSPLLLGGGAGDPPPPPHVVHLQAQADYKQGRFAEVVDTYRRHFSSSELSSDVELSANLLSALISAQSLSEAAELVDGWQLDSSPSTSYELAFNAGCVRMECGDFAGALRLVRRAQQIAQSTLTADGLSEAEVADETAVLKVQEAYLLQRMHQPDAALQLYTSVLHQRPSDGAVVSVASNNVISLRSGEVKVFDSLKRSSKALQGPVDEERLTNRQRLLLHFNRSLVLLSSKQLQPCHAQVEQMKKDFPSSELPILAEAALASVEKKSVEAESILQSFVTGHPATSVECRLALAHLSLMKGDVKRAISLLDGLQGESLYLQSLPSFASSLTASALRSSSAQAPAVPALRERPAVVAALAVLHEQSGDEATAVREVDAAVERWAVLASAASASPAVRAVYLGLLDCAAGYHMSHQHFAAAARLIQRSSAESSQPKGGAGKGATGRAASSTMDERALENIVKLVLATAPVDLEAAQAQASLLPPIDLSRVSAAELDLKAAEEPGKRRKAVAASADDGAAADGQPEEEKQRRAAAAAKAKAQRQAKRKRRRRVLYPKGFDPTNPNNPPPDPERWLPKWERTQLDHRGRKRKVQEGPMRGAQGGSSSSAGSWQPGTATAASATASASATSASPSAAASSPQSGSSPSHSAAAAAAAAAEGVEQRADNARPSAAAAAAARKKKKGGKKMGF